MKVTYNLPTNKKDKVKLLQSLISGAVSFSSIVIVRPMIRIISTGVPLAYRETDIDMNATVQPFTTSMMQL